MSIKTLVMKHASRSLLQVQKYSPEILTGLGVLGGVSSAVMAAKATLEVEEIVDEAREHLKVAKSQSTVDPQDHTKDVAYIYTRTALKLGRLYGPSISLGVASIGCVLAAHGIMRRRNAALVAGYKVLEQAFSEYRSRVEAEVGEDREKELYFNVKEEEVDTPDGRKSVKTSSPFAQSEYAKVFDKLNPNWSGNPEYNLLFLRSQQNYANDLLKARGHVFLNDVYDSLGIPRTKAGAVTGWVLGNGDDFIDFGIYDLNRPMALEFINGYEPAIWLDFNVDGIIYDLI